MPSSTFPGSRDAFKADRIKATRRFFASEQSSTQSNAGEGARLVFSETPTDLGSEEKVSGGDYDHQRPLFQLFGGWIVTATRSGLVLIDQHRAHTRILYERFSSAPATQGQGAQQLLFPAVLQLGPADVALLTEAKESLKALGVEVEFPDSATVEVLGLPQAAAERDPAALMDAILEELREAGEVDAELRASRATAGLARAAAIPSGRTLTRSEMLDLVDGLFACQEPDRDPWGRATIATFDQEAVASRFR